MPKSPIWIDVPVLDMSNELCDIDVRSQVVCNFFFFRAVKYLAVPVYFISNSSKMEGFERVLTLFSY